MTRKQNAFTLVEILIVVVILSILAAVVVPQFNEAVESSERSGGNTMVTEMEKAICNFHADIGHWPGEDEAANPGVIVAADLKDDLMSTSLTDRYGNAVPSYYEEWPVNPMTKGDDIAVHQVAAGMTMADAVAATDNTVAWSIIVWAHGVDATAISKVKVVGGTVEP
jgi:prepilin-type N-terminal cleavage/methylation domain-containing protein